VIGALALASLRRHVARTSLAVAGIAVAAALLLDMVMLASGMRESFRRFLLVQGFDLRIAPKGTLPMDTEATIGNASEILAALRANRDIAAATPILGAQLHLLGAHFGLTSFGVGLDPASQADYQLEDGQPVAGVDRIVVNTAFLARAHARLGDTLDVATGLDPQLRTYAGRRRLVVAGVGRFFYTAAGEPVMALPIATLQAMGGSQRLDHASLFLAKVRDSVNVDSVAAWVDRTFPSVSTLSTPAALRQIDNRLGYFGQLALILGAVSLTVGFLLVTTLVTVSVNERVGEIAVMRAIGVRRARVVAQVVLEALGLALVGTSLGLGLGLVTAHYLNVILSDFPGLPAAFRFFLFQPVDAWRALGLLLAAGLLAGAYPAWRASSLPIATTLRRDAVV
jgi:putative ABC transport system permease protein